MSTLNQQANLNTFFRSSAVLDLIKIIHGPQLNRNRHVACEDIANWAAGHIGMPMGGKTGDALLDEVVTLINAGV